MINGKQLEFYEREEVPDEETQAFITEEIQHAPKAPQELLDRINENSAASPADAGGDIDADWEDVNNSGAETVFGHNPTPDQSDVEENAHAMGIDYEDNEPLDLLEKIEKRDRDRYELNESSKSGNDTI
ncbi:MAG TPA: DUF6335 family protein [Pyrinomonadaceae bacterium]|nr:DUF6335 family protein [Pyrinomonadaceae bacterium]